MTSAPLPSRDAFRLRSVYDSSSWFPQPPPPISKAHFVRSTVAPTGPSNSSLQARVHAAGVGVGEGGVAGGVAGMSDEPQAVAADRGRAATTYWRAKPPPGSRPDRGPGGKPRT